MTQIAVVFDLDEGVTVEEAEAAADLLVTLAPEAVGVVLTYAGTEVRP